jgi:hypothetical protein
VEAARALAQRTLADPGDDRTRLSRMFRRCTSSAPQDSELAAMTRALTEFKDRYRSAPSDAEALVKIGDSPVPAGLDKPELAAWTMIASSLLNLYQSTTQE